MRNSSTPKFAKTRRNIANIEEPYWLRKCEYSFLRTGKLNLSNTNQINLSAIKTRSSLKELNISRCKIDSLAGLSRQPNIYVFNAEQSNLSSFKNFSSISNAKKFNLQGTPLSQIPHYIVGLLLFTNQDIIVNGRQVSSSNKKKALEYPSVVRELLDKGWTFQYPCPTNSELENICKEFGIEYTNEENDESDESVNNITITKDSDIIETNNYLSQIDELMNEHESLIEKYSEYFVLSDEEAVLNDKDEEFERSIRELLEEKCNCHFVDGTNVETQILSIVSDLCKKHK